MNARNYSRRRGWLALAALSAACAPRLAAAIAEEAPLPQGVLRPVEVSARGYAETAPSEARLQELAPDILNIHINAVQAKPMTGNNAPAGSLAVTANATVLGVLRSAANAKPGDKIIIVYPNLPPGGGRPATPPVLKEGVDYVAYMVNPDKSAYMPFAGARSFLDTAKPESVVLPPDRTDRGALINPALLPVPQNPSPQNVVRLSGDRLKEWAEIAKSGTQWRVLLRDLKEPLPLKALGSFTPVAVRYYLRPVVAPLTQPTVFVYQAGTEDTRHPEIGVVEVERALIIDPKGRLLGDVLWARRTDKPVLLPLPEWRWLSYKLEVEDPLDRSVQHVSLLAIEQAPVSAPPSTP